MDKSNLDTEKIYSKVIPQDLVKFGLIPELVGRLPVITTLNNLDREALIRILTEPKNALLKQFKELFKMDGVELEFCDDALSAVADALREVAKTAMERKTGARGLRSIIEKTLLPIMYDIPSDSDVKKVVITKECVLNGEKPLTETAKTSVKEKFRAKTSAGPKNVG